MEETAKGAISKYVFNPYSTSFPGLFVKEKARIAQQTGLRNSKSGWRPISQNERTSHPKNSCDP
jgi:hypothetical protein